MIPVEYSPVPIARGLSLRRAGCPDGAYPLAGDSLLRWSKNSDERKGISGQISVTGRLGSAQDLGTERIVSPNASTRSSERASIADTRPGPADSPSAPRTASNALCMRPG